MLKKNKRFYGLRGRGFCALNCEKENSSYFSFSFFWRCRKTFLTGGPLSAQGLHVCCFSPCRNCFSTSTPCASPSAPFCGPTSHCLPFFPRCFCTHWLVVLVVRAAPAARPSLSHYFPRFTRMCCTCKWPPALWLSRGRGGLGAKDAQSSPTRRATKEHCVPELLRRVSWAQDKPESPSNAIKTTFCGVCWRQIFDPISVTNLILMWFEDSDLLVSLQQRARWFKTKQRSHEFPVFYSPRHAPLTHYTVI